MEAALGWIGAIIEWLGRFIPRMVILDTTEGAIKYVGGDNPIYCGPGLHWYWPWMTKWSDYPMARQADRLETQTIETADGITFMASGTMTYDVLDLMKLVPVTYSPVTTVVESASTAMHDVLSRMTWAEIREAQARDTLKTKLKNRAQSELSDYGVRVIRFKLNTLARCRVYKISQSTASEENN